MTDEAIQTAIVERDTLIIEVLPIKTDDDRLRYNAARVQVKDWLARFTVVEKDICDPIYRAWKNAKDRFKDGRKPAEDFDAALERELRADRQRQLEAQSKEQKRLNDLAQKRFDNAIAKGKPTPLPVPVAAIVQDTGKRVDVGGKTLTWVENWKARVVDESLLPREYLMPDMAKLNAAAKANIAVPGMVRVNEEFQR